MWRWDFGFELSLRINIWTMKFTAIIEKSDDGWLVGQIEEIPAAISQGKTIDELKANLIDALKLLMDSNRDETEKEYSGKQVQREEIVLN
jgi:predicted RNase H-like HicB family nuclease